MQAAIERVENGESAQSVAAIYRLSHSTLSRRVRQHQYAIQPLSIGRKLSIEAEDFVCDWIISDEAAGRAPTARQLRSFIAILLREQGLPDTLGRKWVDRFRQRHRNTIRLKKNKLIVYKKIMTSRLDEIEHWFRRLHRIIEARDIKLRNIWNMDETGLQEGFQQGSKVFGSSIIRSHDKPTNDNIAWITIIECVGAEGSHLTPGAIFTGHRLWTDSTPEPTPRWLFSFTDSGFSNRHMIISWFKQAFLEETRP
jgi:transposase-like protein